MSVVLVGIELRSTGTTIYTIPTQLGEGTTHTMPVLGMQWFKRPSAEFREVSGTKRRKATEAQRPPPVVSHLPLPTAGTSQSAPGGCGPQLLSGHPSPTTTSQQSTTHTTAGNTAVVADQYKTPVEEEEEEEEEDDSQAAQSVAQLTGVGPRLTQGQANTAFLHSLEKMVQDSARRPCVTGALRAHPLLAQVEAEVLGLHQQRIAARSPLSVLECVPKAYEDGMLRKPAGGNERACVAGVECEGFAIAATLPHVPTEAGFCLVRFTSPHGVKHPHCLLCLRKETMIAYYNCVATHRRTPTLLQPHRVAVGRVGEYDVNACIDTRGPPGVHGITDPFVKHERHHYDYDTTADGEPRIKQRSVNFRLLGLPPNPG